MSNPQGTGDARMRLARQWAAAIAPTAYVAMSPAQVEQMLLDLVGHLVDGIAAGGHGASTRKFERVGERLAEVNFTGPQSLFETIQVLGAGLPAQPEVSGLDDLPATILVALGGVAAGYTSAVRNHTLEQQEDVNRALVHARRQAERRLDVSEERFRGVFTSTAAGIAITDLDGNFVEINDALIEILGYQRDELTDRTLYDLVQRDDAAALRIAYYDLARADVSASTVRMQYRMTRCDGESAHVYLTGSVLHNADGVPSHFVTLVEDISELQSLQESLIRQALHDVQTGLPNRQYFRTTLERVLAKPHQSTDTVTLLYLDIDGFSVINSGLGHRVGDQLLQIVAKRLADVFTSERATIARLGDDEFAVLIEGGPNPPDVAALASTINDELSEPTYIANLGLAASATIGIVRRQVRGATADELIRQADSTLQRAKANGKRQRLLYDERLDAANRDRFTLAASMPGAMENGEFRLMYEPRVQLDGRHVVAIEAMLEWHHPERGVVSYERCMELADLTGMVLPLSKWLLRTASEQAVGWRTELGGLPTLSIQLAPAQANDPDLVRTVDSVLDATGLPPAALQLGIPVRSLLYEDLDAENNLDVLIEMGVQTALVGFGGCEGSLGLVEDHRVQAVKVSPCLAVRLAVRPASLPARGTADFVRLLRDSGVSVIVPSIQSEAQATWWLELGADIAQGGLFSAPITPDEIPGLLTS
jgi:diguanylate cyclase (GGDEF)-like protein/PAS domain S-box-containing protein